MNFIEELRWRGMLHDLTPGIEEHLNGGMRTGYIGFDPTAPSLTIGNYVQIMILTHFQLCGHQPIFLLGGATGRIGDPSGKDTERTLKSYAELDRNLEHQRIQASKFLKFANGDNEVMMLNNYDFYSHMNVLDFLRDVGKNLTVNYMLSKEAVKKRLESGISFTEFSYQLLQAYDFLCLYNEHQCTIQMGGSDQWGNITSGTEFIRRNTIDGKAYAITTPLLTKADGSKFGKSESGNIWLDPTMTSPYKFYQFWINTDDADLPKFMRYFSLKSKKEIEELESAHSHNPNALKRILAEEVTSRVHSIEAFENALSVSELLFNSKATQDNLRRLDEDSLHIISEEIPSFKLKRSAISDQNELLDTLVEHTHIFTSKSEGRKAISNNAVAVNKEKIEDFNYVIHPNDLLHNKYTMIENGKKNKYMLIWE